MFEPNATQIVAYVRQDTQFQLITILKRYEISNYTYTEIPALEPGQSIRSRFEFVITDASGVDAQRVLTNVLRGATGYQPPDAHAIATRVYFQDNGM